MRYRPMPSRSRSKSKNHGTSRTTLRLLHGLSGHPARTPNQQSPAVQPAAYAQPPEE